jgi:hypothetical protein
MFRAAEQDVAKRYVPFLYTGTSTSHPGRASVQNGGEGMTWEPGMRIGRPENHLHTSSSLLVGLGAVF